MRTASLQFDDDLNKFVLPGYAVVALGGRQQISGRLTATVAVENLLGREYLVALSPAPNIGAPRLWRVGLLWRLGM